MRYKAQLVVFALLASMAFLTGCPAPNPGGFWVEGNLSAVADKLVSDFSDEVAKSLEKGGGDSGNGINGLSYDDIVKMGDKMKEDTTQIWVYLYENSETSTTPVGMGKAGTSDSGPDFYQFPIQVVDHQFKAHCGGIFPGTYDLCVSFQDVNGTQLFSGWKTIVIEGGVDKHENLIVDFVYNYPFMFCVVDLPGRYQTNEWGYGEAHLISIPSCEDPYISWWRNGEMVFRAYLPLNFKGGILYIVDADGNDVQSELPLVIVDLDWANFTFADILLFPYVATDALGSFDLSFVFNWEKGK
jgi:hypothetical protein